MTQNAVNPMKIVRISAGMTQEELADIAKVDVRTMARYENGQASLPRDVLARISAALSIPIVSPDSPGAAANNLIKQLEDVARLRELIQEITFDDVISDDQVQDWETVRRELHELFIATATALSVSF